MPVSAIFLLNRPGMKTARLVLSVIGLVAISLTYITHNLYFLVIAIGAFIGGLYFMGAIGPAPKKQNPAKKDDGSAGKKNDRK